MPQKAQIKTKNKFIVDHKSLIKGFSPLGLDKIYHDPSVGLTVILTEDKLFSHEWHEGAHHFITQKDYLGFVMSTLSDALWVLVQMYIKRRNDPETADVVRKLYYIRAELLKRYHIPHEIFAITTEIRGNIQKTIKEQGHGEESTKEIKDGFNELYNSITKNTDNELYSIAFNWINSIIEKFGDIFYINSIINWSTNFLLLDFLDTDIRDLLSRNVNEIAELLPNPLHFFKWLMDNRPNNFPENFVKSGIKLDKLMFKYKNLENKVPKIIEKGDLLLRWAQSIRSIFYPNETALAAFDSFLLRDLKYLLIVVPEIQRQWEEKTEFKKFDETLSTKQSKYVRSQHLKIQNLYSSISKKDSESEKYIIWDPLNIPPPITITNDGQNLKFLIRQDINQPDAIPYLSLKLADFPISDSIISRNDETPIICIQNLCNKKILRCHEGLGKCGTSITLLELYKSMGLNPTLLCNAYEEALIFKVSELTRKKGKFYSCKLEFEEVPLSLEGISL